MSKRIILVAAAVLLTIWGTSFTEIEKDFKFTEIDDPIALDSPNLNRSRAACSIQKHDDTAFGFYTGFVTDDRIVTYYDISAECGASPYPFEIQSLNFTLFAPTAAYQWPIEVDIVVYDLAGADSCSGPGNELCRFSITCDSAIFRLPHIGTANFPDPCCVTGPVYIGIEYTDTDPGTFPSVVFDKSSPVPMCENWGYSIGSWFEWYSFWGAPQPGYPIYRVEGETQSTACNGRVVINEICPSPGETGRSFELLDHEWVEIHNAGFETINLTEWTISNNDGTASISLPSWDLPPGSFLQIHQKSGTNDNDFDDLDGHYYTGSTSEIFDDNEDECALYSGAPSVSTIVDFVSWSGDGSYSPGSAHGMAVSNTMWTSGEFVNTATLISPDCISRYFDGHDRDVTGDWRIISWTLYAQNMALQPENPLQELPKNRAVLSVATPTFDWTDFPDADEYALQVDNNWDFSSPEINVSGLLSSNYNAVSAVTDDGYFWRVRAIVIGTPTPWAAEWLFVVETSRALRGASGQLPAPHKWQRKDTRLLCLWEQRASTRPGCVETGAHAWDVAHPNQAPPGCPHDNWYCARASVAMVNAKYGGDLSQDRVSYHVCSPLRAQPEGDYGHNIGLSDAQVTTALGWALNGAAINYQLVAAGSFTFAQIKGWVDSLDCFVAAVPGHCLVIDDYFEYNTPAGTNVQIVYSQDPWQGPNDPSVFSYVISGAPTRYWRRHRNNSFDAVWRQPAAGVTARMQEAAVTTDTDGDGIMDFDEQNPRNLDCVHNDTDTDDDQVNDKNEIRNYTFHDQAGHHPGHENNALTFPDVDGDNLRAENDCDSDNESDFDGGEDINGDGFNPIPGAGNVCTRETCQFLAGEFCLGVAVDKDTYFLGEPVYIVDYHFSRQTHTYHSSSTYNYEKGPLCPTKADGSGLGHNGSFTTDAGGHAVQTLVENCLTPGVKYLTVDVLNDNLYSTPDNLDPQTCWECLGDWFHGFHYATDYTYHNAGSTWPGYTYPVICLRDSPTPGVTTYTIECPWWWWCYQWPPIIDRYWLAVRVDRELIDNSVITITQPPSIVFGTPQDCNPPPLQMFNFDPQLTFQLEGTSQDPQKQWLAFSTQQWQLPDSLISTRLHLEVQGGTKFATSPYVDIMAGDSVYGWSPTVYDSIPITIITTCCTSPRGDVNGDGNNANILDLNFLVNRIFRGGPAAACPEEADCNSDGTPSNILDLNFLVNRIFRGGALPGPC